MDELTAIQARYPRPLDEPEAIRFAVALREAGVLSDEHWRNVVDWFEDAMRSLNRPRPEKAVIDFSSDPRMRTGWRSLALNDAPDSECRCGPRCGWGD